MSWLSDFFDPLHNALEEIGDKVESALQPVIPEITGAAEAFEDTVTGFADAVLARTEPELDQFAAEIEMFVTEAQDTIDLSAIGAALEVAADAGAEGVDGALTSAWEDFRESDAFNTALDSFGDLVTAVENLFPVSSDDSLL